MDEVRLDLPQGLPSQEEYHIDLDAPTAGIDDLDFGLDTRFDTRPDDTRDTEAGEDDISYEEAQDEYNSNHANLTASVPTPPGSYDDADDGLDEIGYEDDEIHIDTAEKTAVDGAGGDIGTNNVGLSPGEGTADPASQESVPTDYHDQNTGGLSEIERQVPTFEQIDVEEFDDLTGADSGTGESHLDNTELAKGRGEGGLELTEDDDADDENADDENADQENFGDFENVDVGNMDVGNADGNKSTPELPDVAVEYNHVRYSLFGGPQDHDEDYFLKDVGVLDKPLPQLFSALRDIIVDDISPTDELLIRIDKLDCLEFREHSASPFLRRTFREVLDLYYRLLANDGSGEDRLLIHLIVVPSSEDVFTRLLAASEEGHGLAEIAGSSEEVSPAVNDDYSSKNGGDVEQEEEAAVPEYIEHYGIDEGASEPEDGADFNESALLNAEPRDQRSMVEDFAAEDAVDLGEESAAHFDTFDPEVGEAYSSGDYSQHGRKEVGANAPDTRGNDLPDDSTSFDVVPHEPLTDPFELGNEDGAAATERDKDDIDYSLGGGDTYNSLSNDTLEFALNPDGEQEVTHETDVPEGEGDDVYNPKIGNPGDENILQDGTSTTPQIGNSLSKVNQTETTYASAAQENPSAHTSATSTVNGEEIDYDENDGDFVGPEAEDPAASDANLGTAVDEIDWENADDEGDSIEATAANMTPRSASGKRLRQVEGLESLTDEGDNKRRRT